MTRVYQTKHKKMLAIGFAAALLSSMGSYSPSLEAAAPSDKVVSGAAVSAPQDTVKTDTKIKAPVADGQNVQENVPGKADTKIKAPVADGQDVQENVPGKADTKIKAPAADGQNAQEVVPEQAEAKQTKQTKKAKQTKQVKQAKPGDAAQAANPVVSCKDIAEVKQQLGYAPLGFAEKSGYNCVEQYVLDQKVSDIRYTDPTAKDVKFSVRTARQKDVNTDNISGCQAEMLKENKVSKTTVHSGKAGEKYYSAYWTEGNYDFSVSAINLDEAAFNKAVQELVKESESKYTK